MGAQTLGNALARVALTVANRLGGTATLVSPGTSAVSFDSTSGAFVGAAETRVSVPITPKSARRSFDSTRTDGESSASANVDAFDFVGAIPANALATEPKPRRDKLVFNGVEYRIAAVETACVQNVPVERVVYCRRN